MSKRHNPPLLTWILWYFLLHPPEHPVFHRTLRRASQSSLPLPLIWFTLVVACVVGYSMWAFLLNFNASVALLLPLTMLLLSSVYVVVWIANISLAIIREQQQATYDPICMAPSGAIGANWSLATGILHRGDRFSWIDLGRRLLSGLLLLILTMALLTITFHKGLRDIAQPLWLMLDILLLTLMSYIDHVQSVVLGVLIAMLMPLYIRNATDVHLWSVFIFITLQVITLTVFVFVSLLALNYFKFNHLDIAFSLLIHYLLREIFIHIVWNRLSHQLNVVNVAEIGNTFRESATNR